jgi:DNA-binding PadR family transcriptional regulator
MYEDYNGVALTESVYYILLSLFSPLHGYGIMQNVRDLSNGRVSLGAGTLYGAISTLLDKGYIRPLTMDQDSRKKEYVITGIGKTVVQGEMKRLEELLANGRKIVNPMGLQEVDPV